MLFEAPFITDEEHFISPNKDYTLYCLTSSKDNVPFYVGITCGRLKARLNDHCTHKQSKFNLNKFLYIRNIRENGYVCEIHPILTDLTVKEAFELEIEYIAEFKGLGLPLTNISLGGYVFSPKTRDKMSIAHKGQRPSDSCIEAARKSATGRQMTDHVKASLALANADREVSADTRRKMSLYASNRPQEVNDKISKSLKGRPQTVKRRVGPRGPMSQATKDKISKANSGKKRTPQQRERASEAGKNRPGRPMPAHVKEILRLARLSKKDKVKE